MEFKENNDKPALIGEYISALSNAAALDGKESAYVLWGVRNEDHAIVGTHFEPGATKAGNEELENWLLRLLEPKLDFRFFPVEVDGHRVVLLEIERARRQPTRFEGTEFIRVGSIKKKLEERTPLPAVVGAPEPSRPHLIPPRKIDSGDGKKRNYKRLSI